MVIAGTKRMPAADPDQAPGDPAGDGEEGGQQLAHETISSIATATSSSAKSSETARWGMRCWRAVPARMPSTAGTASQSPVPRSTLP